jgi:hypothetical protein
MSLGMATIFGHGRERAHGSVKAARYRFTMAGRRYHPRMEEFSATVEPARGGGHVVPVPDNVASAL